MENETKINTSNSSKCKNDETEGNSEPESQAIDGSSNFLRRPHKPPYSSLLLPLPSTQDLKKNPFDDIEDKSMAGFTEFRKYKRVNESRKITPYVPEDTSKIQISEEIDVSVIEIKDPEKFILEGKRHIPVSSLRSILNAVLQHPDVGFMTMKRDHMDLVNDYKPYQYTICHYNDLDKSNYVSISPNGLVEFYNDDADFLLLDRLEVEYELYNKLKEMPSFQRYRLWKSFMVWLGKIRRRKFMIAKEKLEVFFIDKYKSVDK